MTARKASAQSPVTLLSLLDLEHGASLAAEADAAAARIALELCPPDATQAERKALGEFLDKITFAVKFPRSAGRL
jgi:hypothetical protein